MGVMRILDATGDTKVSWDVDDPESVEHARRVFAHQRCRAVPFARQAGAPATSASMITDFDAEAEEIIWTRPVVAG